MRADIDEIENFLKDAIKTGSLKRSMKLINF